MLIISVLTSKFSVFCMFFFVFFHPVWRRYQMVIWEDNGEGDEGRGESQ